MNCWRCDERLDIKLANGRVISCWRCLAANEVNLNANNNSAFILDLEKTMLQLLSLNDLALLIQRFSVETNTFVTSDQFPYGIDRAISKFVKWVSRRDKLQILVNLLTEMRPHAPIKFMEIENERRAA